MALQTPAEPIELKSRMLATKGTLAGGDAIDWDSYVVWAGSQNGPASYLWRAWKADLEPLGFSWQKFTKLLRYKTDRMVYWYRGLITWQMLTKEVSQFIEGRYGLGRD